MTEQERSNLVDGLVHDITYMLSEYDFPSEVVDKLEKSILSFATKIASKFPSTKSGDDDEVDD